jgi:hypothetical protein
MDKSTLVNTIKTMYTKMKNAVCFLDKRGEGGFGTGVLGF